MVRVASASTSPPLAPGTPGHFGAEMLADAGGFAVEPVHYRATGDAVTAIVAGEVASFVSGGARCRADQGRQDARTGHHRAPRARPCCPTCPPLPSWPAQDRLLGLVCSVRAARHAGRRAGPAEPPDRGRLCRTRPPRLLQEAVCVLGTRAPRLSRCCAAKCRVGRPWSRPVVS